MYQVEKRECYYVLDRNNQYYEFDTYEKLLYWLEKHRLVYNGIESTDNIDRVGNSWNDFHTIIDYDYYFYYNKRSVDFISVDFIVFDIHNG